MIPTTVSKTRILIEHLDDAGDCCREAQETLEHARKFSPSMDVSEVLDELKQLRHKITSLRASVHRNAYSTSAGKYNNTIFPVSHTSGLIPLS